MHVDFSMKYHYHGSSDSFKYAIMTLYGTTTVTSQKSTSFAKIMTKQKKPMLVTGFHPPVI